MKLPEGGVILKDGKTATDVAREYFPRLPDSELNALIWEETGFPSFWETDDVEACFREQLQAAKERWEKIFEDI